MKHGVSYPFLSICRIMWRFTRPTWHIILQLLLLCFHSPNDVPTEPQRNPLTVCVVRYSYLLIVYFKKYVGFPLCYEEHSFWISGLTRFVCACDHLAKTEKRVLYLNFRCDSDCLWFCLLIHADSPRYQMAWKLEPELKVCSRFRYLKLIHFPMTRIRFRHSFALCFFWPPDLAEKAVVPYAAHAYHVYHFDQGWHNSVGPHLHM